MDQITPFLAYSAALAVAAAIPGPGIAALVGQALGAPMRASILFLAGLALGDVTYLSIAVAGLATLMRLFSELFIVIKLAAGLYLLRIAWTFWTSRGGLTEIRARRGREGLRAFVSGYAITLGNPKTVIFYLALLPTVLDLGHVGLRDWAALSVLTVLILFAVLLPYALLANRARAMIAHPAALHRLNRWAAGFIGSAGVLILGEAARAALRRG